MRIVSYGRGKQFLEVGSTPGEDAMMIAEMIKDSEYYINLDDKTTSGFERFDYNFERSFAVVKCYQVALHATEKLKGRVS